MKKLVLFLGLVLVLSAFVSAATQCSMANSSDADVVYIVVKSSEVKQTYLDLIAETGLTSHVLCSQNVKNYNFSNNKMILVNDEYFTNWADIPINNFPSLAINGRNIAHWGWATRVTTASQSTPFNVSLNLSSDITYGFSSNKTQVYTSSAGKLYYLDKRDVYQGMEIVSTDQKSGGLVIGVAKKGTVLTKVGKTPTQINANTIFFGIYEPNYWTNNTKNLFKNSVLWLAGEEEYDIALSEDANYGLVSFPLVLGSYNIGNLLQDNPEVTSIKTYDPTTKSIITATGISNNKGYFIQVSEDTLLKVSGRKPQQAQEVNLVKGVNLVGLTSLSNKTFNQANLPDEVIEVSKRGDNGHYTIATKYGGVWYNEFELEPGVGYWFKTNEETTWSYNP